MSVSSAHFVGFSTAPHVLTSFGGEPPAIAPVVQVLKCIKPKLGSAFHMQVLLSFDPLPQKNQTYAGPLLFPTTYHPKVHLNTLR